MRQGSRVVSPALLVHTACAGALALSACGPATRPGPDTPHLETSAGTRRVSELTDLEDVRGVARAGERTYVATDAGVLVYRGEALERRVGRAEGLPSEDVTAIVAEPEGSVLAAVAGTLVRITEEGVAPLEGAPTLARVEDLARIGETTWACTARGLVRSSASGWERFGEPFPCTTLAPTPEGALWAGSTAGLFYVDGDVIREHAVSGGIPEAEVRSVIPVLPGQVLAWLAGPNAGVLGFFDGERWSAYALDDVDDRVVGLARGGRATFLVTETSLYEITPSGPGTRLRAISSTPAQVRSFRGDASALEGRSGDAAPAPERALPFSSERSGPTASSAPPLVARWLEFPPPPGMVRVFESGHAAFAAIANRGVVEFDLGGLVAFRSGSLVSEDDLQLATDLAHGLWVRARSGDVAKWIDGRLVRLTLPAELAPQALASGPRGAYLAAIVRGTSTVRVFVAGREGFRLLVERELALPTRLDAIPFLGVGDDGRVWLALRVAREEGSGTRMRGVAVIDPARDGVVYHHRGAPQGEGLPLADEVSSVAFDAAGNAWFATLVGAVRVEEHQAITFDETRGVRGDVVTGIAAGDGQMWIASAEGLGSYADRRFDYAMPAIVREHRPTALAFDAAGTLWAAGRHGLLEHTGGEWHHFGASGLDAEGRAQAGLPTAELVDVEVDEQRRVWLLAEHEVMILWP